MSQSTIKSRIYSALRIRRLIAWSRRLTLPGFQGVSLYDTALFIYQELQKDNLPTRANSVAFSFFLSIFPFVLFVLPLLTLTPWLEHSLSEFETSMDAVIPVSVKQYLLGLVDGIRRDGSVGLQSTGILLSVIFASSGMLTLMNGFDKSHDISFKDRGMIKKRLIAIGLTLLFTLIIVVSIVLIILGQYALSYLITTFDLSTFDSVLFVLFKWLIVFILFYTVIMIIYRYGPSTYRPLRLFNPGATVATVMSILCSVGFSYFINNFGRYNEIYGAVGALIVLLLWLQINAFIILAGFELNASIIVNRDRANNL